MPMASAAAIAVLRPDQVGGLRAGAEAGGAGSNVAGAEAADPEPADPELAVPEGAGTGASGIEATGGTGAAGSGAGSDPTRPASSTAYGAVTVVAQIGWVASGERRVDGCGRAVAWVSGD
jgi:hypothetical protein